MEHGKPIDLIGHSKSSISALLNIRMEHGKPIDLIRHSKDSLSALGNSGEQQAG
jgi:hypothetical protein